MKNLNLNLSSICYETSISHRSDLRPPPTNQPVASAGPLCWLCARALALQSFLDKGDVTARILAVVKGFEKVSKSQHRNIEQTCNRVGVVALTQQASCFSLSLSHTHTHVSLHTS